MILTAFGVGMYAATFYTKALPSPDAGYPAYLPFAILAVAIFVCVISNAVLAHSAIISRNRMAEVILTKRRFWRIMAEKEAAEQANELKQQFISVASHEVRFYGATIANLTYNKVGADQDAFACSQWILRAALDDQPD